VLKERGYTGQNSYLVPDASAAYSHTIRAKGKPSESATRLLRKAGFNVINTRSRNRRITDSIAAMLAKMFPVKGEPSMFFVSPAADELIAAIEVVEWHENGKKVKHTEDLDIVDSARYPVDCFEPAARIILPPASYIQG
jgi:hypothetical protein